MSKKIKYKDVKPIKPRPAAAWKVLVLGDSGVVLEERILITSPEMTIEEAAHCLHNVDRYYITQITVGQFVVTQTLTSYSDDARGINHKGEVITID